MPSALPCCPRLGLGPGLLELGAATATGGGGGGRVLFFLDGWSVNVGERLTLLLLLLLLYTLFTFFFFALLLLD